MLLRRGKQPQNRTNTVDSNPSAVRKQSNGGRTSVFVALFNPSAQTTRVLIIFQLGAQKYENQSIGNGLLIPKAAENKCFSRTIYIYIGIIEDQIYQMHKIRSALKTLLMLIFIYMVRKMLKCILYLSNFLGTLYVEILWPSVYKTNIMKNLF